MSTKTPTGRNQPCPCGSGRKYKVCCGKSGRDGVPAGRGWTTAIIAGVVLGVVMGAFYLGNAQQADVQPASMFPPGSVTPAPWFYDEVNNRHWHPGHGHWHSGAPPSPEQREPGALPAAGAMQADDAQMADVQTAIVQADGGQTEGIQAAEVQADGVQAAGAEAGSVQEEAGQSADIQPDAQTDAPASQ